MKDVVTPAPPEEVCKVVKKCLEGAALVNYTKISDYAEVEGTYLAILIGYRFICLIACNSNTEHTLTYCFYILNLLCFGHECRF